MECNSCSETIQEDSLYCNFCGKKQPKVVSHHNYNTSHGIWHVTTEGDCEGRSTKDLGIHEGHIDEIARALASESYYSLHFCPANINKKHLSRKVPKSVNITLDIASGTWDLKLEERKRFFEKLLKDRPVTITAGEYYSSVTLTFEK